MRAHCISFRKNQNWKRLFSYGILFLLSVICFIFPLFSQQPNVELGLLDMNTAPAFVKNPEQVMVSGDKAYLVTYYNGDYDLLAFDGNETQILLENEEEINIFGSFQNGILLKIGSIPPPQHLYYLDNDTYTLTLLHEFNINYKDHLIFDDIAYFTDHSEGLYLTNGTPEGTTLLNQFPDTPDGVEFRFTVDELVYFEADQKLWRTDGTSSGTFKISDYIVNTFYDDYVISNHKVFFIATDYIHGDELWVTDGTVSGTGYISNFNPPDNCCHDLSAVTKTVDGVVFAAENTRLWKRTLDQ